MTARERFLAAGVLLVVVLAGGAFLLYHFLMVPLRDRDASIQVLSADIERKDDRVREITAERAKLTRWRALSLPTDIDLARREYERYLSELLRESGFAPGAYSVVPKPTDSKTAPTVPGKGPIYTRLTFTVQAHGSLNDLVHMLKEFYHTSLLHQVQLLTIQRPLTPGPQQAADALDINLTIEALSVAGGGNRPYLLPNLDPRLMLIDTAAALRGGPAGMALAAWGGTPMGPSGPGTLAEPHRDYAAIASRNIFFGDTAQNAAQRDDVEVTRFVHLTDITNNGRYQEAFLYDRTSNRKTRLRAQAGFDSFRIQDSAGETLVRGKVTRIDARDLVFQVDDKVYAMHVGQSLDEALRKALSKADVEKMEKSAAVEKISKIK